MKKCRSTRSAARTRCRSPSIRRPGWCTSARGTCLASRSSRQPKEQVIGTNSTGVVGRVPAFKPGDVVGHFVAIDPLTGEKKWDVPLTDMPSSAGMLATGGGLVFTGKLTGEFVALDAATGAHIVAVQDRVERQRDGDHLHAQRTAVRDRAVRPRRRSRPPLRSGQGADRRIGVDVRVDARVSRRARGPVCCAQTPPSRRLRHGHSRLDAGRSRLHRRRASARRWRSS